MGPTQRLFSAASSSFMLLYKGVSSQVSDSFSVLVTRDINFAELVVEDSTICAASNVRASAPSTYGTSESKISNISDNCYGRILFNHALSQPNAVG